MSGRTQQVSFYGTLSDNVCDIDCGVPQGSILAPLLYLIYVNDFHMCLDKSVPILFADDTTLIVTANTYEDLYKFVNIDLIKLYEWLCMNKLIINLEKTKYILYSLAGKMFEPPNMSVKLNGETIEKVDSFKFLGLHINSSLSWKTHMHEILNKIRRNLCVVRKIAHFLNKNSLLQLYHSSIMSHIRYGIIVWHQGNISI